MLVLLRCFHASSGSLRFIKSYDRGHAMSVVFRGVPDSEDIMLNFGGDAKKKVFMYWKPGKTHFCTHPPFKGRSSTDLLLFGVADNLSERICCKQTHHFSRSLVVIYHCEMLLVTI